VVVRPVTDQEAQRYSMQTPMGAAIKSLEPNGVLAQAGFEVDDIILGINQQAEYNEKQLVLNPGEMILLYTDGITEATNPDGEMYGEERLMNLLRINYTMSASALSQKILESVKNFQADTDQDDDITLMVVKRL